MLTENQSWNTEIIIFLLTIWTPHWTQDPVSVCVLLSCTAPSHLQETATLEAEKVPQMGRLALQSKREKEIHKVHISMPACLLQFARNEAVVIVWNINSKQSNTPSDNSPTTGVCNTLKMNESGLISWNTVLSPNSPASQPSCTSQIPLPSKGVRVQDYTISCIIMWWGEWGLSGWGCGIY